MMATKAHRVRHCFVLLLVSAVVVATTTSATECQSERQASQRKGQQLGEYQANCLPAMNKVFSCEQNCPPCQNNIAQVKKLIAEAEARIEKKMQAMMEAKLTKMAAECQVQVKEHSRRAAKLFKNQYKQLLYSESTPTIYFATEKGGLKTYSLTSSETSRAVNTTEALCGVTYDFQRDFVYWSTLSEIYRKQGNGSHVTTVLSTKKYGWIHSLDFDWLTRNLYMGTHDGDILACGTQLASSSSSLNCASVVTGQGPVLGIALNPIQGIMYWTMADNPGLVKRGGMDGSDVSVIFTGLSYPAGIAIDFHSSRIYWTVGGEGRVQSSHMQGKDVQTVMQLPRGSGTYGIALYGSRIYVTNWSSNRMQSFTTAGQDLQELHTDTNHLYHLAIISARPDRPTNRTNHCANHGCSNVCVLTRTASKCVA